MSPIVDQSKSNKRHEGEELQQLQLPNADELKSKIGQLNHEQAFLNDLERIKGYLLDPQKEPKIDLGRINTASLGLAFTELASEKEQLQALNLLKTHPEALAGIFNGDLMYYRALSPHVENVIAESFSLGEYHLARRRADRLKLDENFDELRTHLTTPNLLSAEVLSQVGLLKVIEAYKSLETESSKLIAIDVLAKSNILNKYVELGNLLCTHDSSAAIHEKMARELHFSPSFASRLLVQYKDNPDIQSDIISNANILSTNDFNNLSTGNLQQSALEKITFFRDGKVGIDALIYAAKNEDTKLKIIEQFGLGSDQSLALRHSEGNAQLECAIIELIPELQEHDFYCLRSSEAQMAAFKKPGFTDFLHVDALRSMHAHASSIELKSLINQIIGERPGTYHTNPLEIPNSLILNAPFKRHENSTNDQGHPEEELRSATDYSTHRNRAQTTYSDLILPQTSSHRQLDEYKAKNPALQTPYPGTSTTRTSATDMVTNKEFGQLSVNIFHDNDTNKNGYLSKDELAKAVQSNQILGEGAQVLSALYAQIHRIEELHNDEWFDENNGISLRDIESLDREMRQDHLDSVAKLLKYESSSFLAIIDKDNSGRIENIELSAAIRHFEETRSAQLEDIARIIHDNYANLCSLHTDGDGLSGEDLRSIVLRESNGKITIAQRVNSQMRQTHLSQQKDIGVEAYTHPEAALIDISPNAINQGQIKDCYFLAALGSVAQVSPKKIQDMIQDNGNGTYTVTFAGDPKRPVTVDKPSETELGLYNSASKYGLWAPIIEKAYGKYRQTVDWFPIGDTPTEGADLGGRPAEALKLLTGQTVSSKLLFFTRTQTLKTQLDDAFNGGNIHAVTVTSQMRSISASFRSVFRSEDSIPIADTTTMGFARQHAYSILEFDPNGPHGGTVTIRDPYGGEDNAPSGKMKISLSDLQRNFSQISISD